MTIVDYFDQARIVNTPARSDRRRETECEFRKHGFPINSGGIEFFEGIQPLESDSFPNPGVRGCFLSHMSILLHAYETNVENILIMEDDITFSKHIQDYGELATKSLNDIDWDIAYLGHSLESETDKLEWTSVDYFINMTHCYAINKRAIKPLYEFLEVLLSRPEGHPDGGPMHFDGALYTFIRSNPSINAYYYSYNLAYQRPSRTDLHSLRIYDRNIFLRPVVRLLRNVKRIYLGMLRTVVLASLSSELWPIQVIISIPIK